MLFSLYPALYPVPRIDPEFTGGFIMYMKKIVPVLLVAFFIMSCATLDLKKKPGVRIEGIDIESISLTDATILLHVSISNPYPLPLKLDDLRFAFYLENRQFMKTATKKGLNIPARGKGMTDLKVNMKYSDNAAIAGDYAKKEYLNGLLHVQIVLPPVLNRLTFDYRLKKKIPVFRPTVSVTRFSMKKGRLDPLKGDYLFTINFDIELKNRTRSKVSFIGLDYELDLNGKKIAHGKGESPRQEGDRTVLTVSNKVSARKLGNAFIRSMNKKNRTYSIRGNTLIQLPGSIKKKPLRLEFNTGGKLPL